MKVTRLVHPWGQAMVVFLLLVGAAKSAGKDPAEVRPLGTPGLSALERADFYHLAEGSEIFPIEWMKALISSKTGRPFLENLERFGLLTDREGPEIVARETRWRLPVGLTLWTPRDLEVEMIGVNCSACHVGAVSRTGRTLRIDGAPNLFDIETFYGELF